MAKKTVNAISKGRAAKGSREASGKTVKLTRMPSGAQQYVRGDTTSDRMRTLIEYGKAGDAAYRESDGSLKTGADFDQAVRTTSALNRAFFDEYDADTQRFNQRLARIRKQGSYADGGEVKGYRVGGFVMGGPGEGLPERGGQQVSGKVFRGTF